MVFNETDILSEIKRGNPDSFKLLFNNYYGALCHMANGYLNDKQLAEEVADDVFSKIWELRSSLDIHTSLKAYMIRAVRNRCINHLEMRKSSKYHLNDLFYKEVSRDETIPDDYDTPLTDLVAVDLQKAIDKAIETLPRECKEIFRMSRFEDLKYEEIARQRNISVNTVKSQMKIALQKLRQALAQYIL